MPSSIMKMHILLCFRRLVCTGRHGMGAGASQTIMNLELWKERCVLMFCKCLPCRFSQQVAILLLKPKYNKPFSPSNSILEHTLLQYLTNIYCLQRQQHNMKRQKDPFDILWMLQECSRKVRFAKFQSLICSSVSICLVPLHKEAMSREKISLKYFKVPI